MINKNLRKYLDSRNVNEITILIWNNSPVVFKYASSKYVVYHNKYERNIICWIVHVRLPFFLHLRKAGKFMIKYIQYTVNVS